MMQFLDEEPRHDGLAGAGVIGEQEPQRLPRQHLPVDRGDLMRKRLNDGRVNSHHWVEEVREMDAVGLGDEAQQAAVLIERPGGLRGDYREHGLAVAVDELARESAADILVDHVDRARAVPANVYDAHRLSREYPLEEHAANDVFQSCHF